MPALNLCFGMPGIVSPLFDVNAGAGVGGRIGRDLGQDKIGLACRDG